MSTATKKDLEKQLCDAATEGADHKIRKLLIEHPDLDVNGWRDESNQRHSPLLTACLYGRFSTIALLLAHPNINVNTKDQFGRTIFFTVIDTLYDGDQSEACLVKLLEDDRVDIDEPDDRGRHPFMMVLNKNLYWVVHSWIALRRIDSKMLEVMMTRGHANLEIENLLKWYIDDPIDAKRKARSRMRIPTRSQFMHRPIFTRELYADLLRGKIMEDHTPAAPEHHLWYAVEGGRTSEVKEILTAHPHVNINWEHSAFFGQTILRKAVYGANSTIVSLLLATVKQELPIYPDRTLLEISCHNLDSAHVRPLILRCPYYYNVKEDFQKHWYNMDVISDCIAYDKCAGLNEKIPAILNEAGESNADGARPWTLLRTRVVALLKEFRDHPEVARQKVRRETGWYSREAMYFFGPVIFICEGLLVIKPNLNNNTTARFFRITARLPLEIQMVLCLRAVRSTADIIRADIRENAFKLLAATIG